MSGAQAAQRLIERGGLYDVRIEGVQGNLTDHYDPRTNVLRLSQGVYSSNSVAALAIAAHELGHAMQDKDEYLPLRLRAAIVPMVNIGSYLGWIYNYWFAVSSAHCPLGVAVFGGSLCPATLPVSQRLSAPRLLRSGLIVGEDEARESITLNAAALTTSR
jgi:Zn-dependent membrane protease YugP